MDGWTGEVHSYNPLPTPWRGLIKQLFKQMVIEYSSPHKDLASILLCYHKEKCFYLSLIKTFIFPTEIHVVEKIEIITAIVTHP